MHPKNFKEEPEIFIPTQASLNPKITLEKVQNLFDNRFEISIRHTKFAKILAKGGYKHLRPRRIQFLDVDQKQMRFIFSRGLLITHPDKDDPFWRSIMNLRWLSILNL